MLTILLFAGLRLGGPSVTAERITYRSWPDCVRLSNGQVEAVYVPQIGRMMRYAKVGGRNWLWENSGNLATSGPDWKNYGGDKLWIAPQSLWGWPPDPALDGSPVEVKLEGTTIRCEGQPSQKSGVQFFRTISMDPRTGDLKLRNEMLNLTEKPMKRSVWEVAQLDDPETIRVKLTPSKQIPAGWNTYDKVEPDPLAYSTTPNELIVKRHPTKFLKYGASSRQGALYADQSDDTFEIQTNYNPSAEYPDEGRAQQIYTNGGEFHYVELELVSPMTWIKPKQKLALDVRMSIRKRDRRPKSNG